MSPQEEFLHRLPIMNEDAMGQCVNGDCMGCGLCCTAFEITIPVSVDPHSGIELKAGGTPCKHLALGEDGNIGCSLQHLKGIDPRLAVCHGWSGTEGRFHDLLEAIDEMIVSPSTLADIARIRTMRLQGTSSLLRNPFMTWINCASCIDSYVVHLRIIPDDIFESMGLREALAEQSPDNLLPLFEKIRMSPTDSVHREFVTKYCPHILGKWE